MDTWLGSILHTAWQTHLDPSLLSTSQISRIFPHQLSVSSPAARRGWCDHGSSGYRRERFTGGLGQQRGPECGVQRDRGTRRGWAGLGGTRRGRAGPTGRGAGAALPRGWGAPCRPRSVSASRGCCGPHGFHSPAPPRPSFLGDIIHLTLRGKRRKTGRMTSSSAEFI